MEEVAKNKELITQEKWCQQPVPARPLETKVRRLLGVWLARFIVAKPKHNMKDRGAEKRHKQDGLKRMQHLALILWALTARGEVTGIKNDQGFVRTMGGSMRALSQMCVESVELFRNGRPINSGATFIQSKMKRADFILKEGGSLNAVLANLCYQAVFLWLLAGYAQQKEEDCDPDNYGFANVRLAGDTAWEWVEYLSDVIELVASLQYQRLK